MKITTNRTLSVIVFFITAFMLFEIVDTSNFIAQPLPTPTVQANAEAEELIPTISRIIEHTNVPIDICGTDNRVSSNNAAVGRIRRADGGTCTGFIISNGLIVTAGHCMDDILESGTDIIEFNVKDSQSDGTFVNSDPEDRYVINEAAITNDDYFDDTFGPVDWGVFRVYDNEVTGLQPIIAQNAFFEPEIPGTSLPSTTIRVTGYGQDSGTNNATLQTHAITANFSVSTNSTIEYSVDTRGYNSGSPIINDNTGNVIGVHTDGDGCSNSGTTFRYSDFWNAVKPEGAILTKLDQRRESGSQYTYSTIGVWNGSGFSNQYIIGPLPSVTSNFGEIEVFRGSQNLVTSPNEKFNRWTSNNTGDLTDVTNHKEFPIYENSTVTSQLKKVYNATIGNYYPEFPSLDPSSDKTLFKDPWLIDYNDPEYGNNTRNRGYFAPFKEVNSGPSNNIGISSSYKGVFLNQSLNEPHYILKAPETVTFGGNLGERSVGLISWEGDNADFENSDTLETGVVFTGANAEVTANLKISQASNNFGTFKANQRKVVRTGNGWQHQVYESMGHIWYEAKPPSGSWEFVPRDNSTGSPLNLDTGGGKAPSIDRGSNDESMNGGDEFTVVAWQEGAQIKIHRYYRPGGTGNAYQKYGSTLTISPG